ncbi:hypothetical protein CO151_03205 [bacterium CG_4_9_14_3_um_filter_65_15]|nr:MAG: hypothetical protein CO151_03205 [bacterium CG_4_9_14_3_um_filter_65_15]
MKKHLFGVALLSMCLMCLGGVASAQYTDIDTIQTYTPVGVPASPFAGQVVTVHGVVYENLRYSSGSHYIQGATGGISIYQSGTSVAEGSEVEVTGTVGAFSGEIQLGTATFTVLSTGNTVVPTPMNIEDILATYENVGTLVSTIGTVAIKNAFNFSLANGLGDTILVYIDSTTGVDIGAVALGDTYQVTSPVVTFNSTIELKPRWQADLVENPGGDTLPVISSVNADNWVPEAADAVTISATIVDDFGVNNANLYYRDSDGTIPGAWSTTAMSNTSGDTWAGTIPGGHSSSQIDFYIEATDTGVQTVTQPGNAPTGFRSMAVGFTSIYAMQYAHPDSASQSSSFNGKFLNIRGVVTVGTGDSGAASKFYVQEPAVNPGSGSYAFGGVLVYETSGTFSYYRGDAVALGGKGSEYFGMTEFVPNNADAVYLTGFGQELPAAPYVATNILSDQTTNLGEAWEAVWVKTGPVAVTDTLGFAAYGEFDVSSTGAQADSLTVSPTQALTYVAIPGDVVKPEGFMEYSYGNFVIRPFADQYLVLTGASAVEGQLPPMEKAGGLTALYPNPFNPNATIKFKVNQDNLVQLNVYSIRGEKVRTLMQDALTVGDYTVHWDGKDDAGRNLASGTYFARLRIGAEVVQVRKMIMVK